MTVSILDIEGTICPILFVKDILFPYFLHHFESYLETVDFPITPHQNELASVLVQFPTTVTKEKSLLVAHIKQLVANDVKDSALKGFQGVVWKRGYERGEITAPLFEDAIAFIKNASPSNPIYIYSSGSVPAQKLLFSHANVDGTLADLTAYLSGYFDITTAGPKTDKSSYEKILRQINTESNDAVFYTDNVNEVKASLAAHIPTKLFIRPGNAPLAEEDLRHFDIIHSF